MPTVSEQLRRGRETQQMTVEQVAEATKIKSDHVRALDEGNFDTFTAPVYIKGFVRSYGTLLKLDIPELLNCLDQELRQSKKFSTTPSLTGHQRNWVDKLMYLLSKVRWRIWLPVFGVLALAFAIAAGIRSWQTSKATDPMKKLSPGIHQGNPVTSGETLTLPKGR